MASSGSHKGHSDQIKDFAAGTPFGRGERPRKGTKWDLVSQKVEKCPKYRNASNVDVMGKAIRCAGAIVDLPNTVGSQNMQCFPSVKFKQGEGSSM